MWNLLPRKEKNWIILQVKITHTHIYFIPKKNWQWKSITFGASLKWINLMHIYIVTNIFLPRIRFLNMYISAIFHT